MFSVGDSVTNDVFSLKTSFVTLSPTLNMPRGRLSLPWMLCMLWNVKAALSTVSEVNFINYRARKKNGPSKDH